MVYTDTPLISIILRLLGSVVLFLVPVLMSSVNPAIGSISVAVSALAAALGFQNAYTIDKLYSDYLLATRNIPYLEVPYRETCVDTLGEKKCINKTGSKKAKKCLNNDTVRTGCRKFCGICIPKSEWPSVDGLR